MTAKRGGDWYLFFLIIRYSFTFKKKLCPTFTYLRYDTFQMTYTSKEAKRVINNTNNKNLSGTTDLFFIFGLEGYFLFISYHLRFTIEYLSRLFLNLSTRSYFWNETLVEEHPKIK